MLVANRHWRRRRKKLWCLLPTQGNLLLSERFGTACVPDLILWFLSVSSVSLLWYFWQYFASGPWHVFWLWSLCPVDLASAWYLLIQFSGPALNYLWTCVFGFVVSAILDFCIFGLFGFLDFGLIWILELWTDQGSDFVYFGLWPWLSESFLSVQTWCACVTVSGFSLSPTSIALWSSVPAAPAPLLISIHLPLS